MVIAKVFRNGRNQAVRIPVEMTLDGDAVSIEKQGDDAGPREALDVIKSLNAPAASIETMIQESVAGRYSDSH